MVPINAQLLQREGIRFEFFRDDEHVATLEDLNTQGVSEGDGAFALGFPMGLVGGTRNFVVVRQATVARIRDAIAGHSPEILLDSFSFPGNSGGPIVLRPEITRITGTKSPTKALLFGVMQGYLPYQDVAVSRQSGNERVVFEENSGLAKVVPIHYAREAMLKVINPQATR